MNSTAAYSKPKRLVSLDALRGFTIAAMVIDRDEADGGGFFAEEDQFKVRKVRVNRGRFYK